MPLRKKVKPKNNTITIEVPIDGDLSLRIEKISEQTGLSRLRLLQKWVLQEESMIGLVQYGKGQSAGRVKADSKTGRRQTSDVKKQRKTSAGKPESLDYRKTLAKRVKKLKKEGMTLKKIAETFNDEKVSTVSGTGKWYTSSIAWLMNSYEPK